MTTNNDEAAAKNLVEKVTIVKVNTASNYFRVYAKDSKQIKENVYNYLRNNTPVEIHEHCIFIKERMNELILRRK